MLDLEEFVKTRLQDEYRRTLESINALSNVLPRVERFVPNELVKKEHTETLIAMRYRLEELKVRLDDLAYFLSLPTIQ